MKTAHDIKALIFNIQRFSIHDGPGIRTTIFFKGCPLSCLWCANPEGIETTPQIVVRGKKCIHSGRCRYVCSQGAIVDGPDGEVQVDWEKCNQCLKCAEVCPTGAISCAGREVSLEDMLAATCADSQFFSNSGGGVTASGGEPLYQWKFVRELFKALRSRGIHTALDTSGYAAWQAMEEILPYTDLVLYDLKHMNSRVHRELTGRDNSIILANAEKTAERATTWFRVPLVPGYNDSAENINEVAQFASLLRVRTISLLTYHEFGKHKYEQIGRPYLLKNANLIQREEHVARLCDLIRKYGLNVVLNS